MSRREPEWDNGRMHVHINEWGEFVFQIRDGSHYALEAHEAQELGQWILASLPEDES